MKLVSWNVNGLRACSEEGVSGVGAGLWIADVFCLQETKMERGQAQVEPARAMHEFWNSAEKKGYSRYSGVYPPRAAVCDCYGIGH